MRISSLAAMLALSVIGCGDKGDPPASSTRPDAPDANDPAFQISGNKQWYLIGNAATPGDDQMTVTVVAPEGTGVVDAWIGATPVRLQPQDGGAFGAQLSLADVPAGTQSIVFAADGASTAFGAATFQRSAPYYVLVSTDWDFSDPGDTALADIDDLHAHHPIRMTDFVGPYTYTDPAVTQDRRDVITAFLKKQRDVNHDELGLHIHPYCNFVTDAGLTCITDKSTVYAEDTTGYTIELDAYDRTQMGTLLDHADAIFTAQGLGHPHTFRAGGWTASAVTLGALADKGYIADTSALNWAQIEEWKGHLLYDWNMEHWGPIGDTSQPYYPTEDDQLGSDAAPKLSMLEVPDNGVMIDYVSVFEMYHLFDANWDGQPLAHPVTLMMGFHPSVNYTAGEQYRVDSFLTYADAHLATADLGPVVYTTLSDLVPAFPRD